MKVIGGIRVLAALALVSSIVWQVTDRLAHGLFRPAEYFAYFSIQGTMICAVVLAVTGVRALQGLPETKLLHLVRLSTTVYVVVISVVYNAVAKGSYLKLTIVDVLTAVDAILLGTVLLVIGYGLYELFVDDLIEVPDWLQVKNLDDLKSKLIGVVVAIIAVVFVGVFVDANRADEVVAYGVGAGALVAGLALFAYATGKPSSEAKPAERKVKPKSSADKSA